MLKCHLSVQIENTFSGLLSEKWLTHVVESALSAAGVDEAVGIELVIATDDTVHELNRTYRGIDATTDVLAFAFSEPSQSEDKQFVMPPGEVHNLGEVIVSYPRAERQAAEHGHSIEQELSLLIAHGVLHLLGYDHEEPDDERKMRALEAKILDSIKSD